ncbi:hsp90 co-chaperone Cdc37 [Daphnia magna]|uniref:hsp90 co-chaperone Cdc37 n=1 Tax=Daphnia magna TaxID=35525 RepID=UPI001402662D|nr:hsp90 co-chaperone Cdc37 [Daphnia magna]
MVDYSKWKNIEISDDEDDTHPNVDTPSLFKWRHEARVEKMKEMEQEKAMFLKEKNENTAKLKETKIKYEQAQKDGTDLSDLKKQLEELEVKRIALEDHEEQMKKKEKLMPWNVDTISQPGFSKTVVNVGQPKKQVELTDEEKEIKTREFFKKHEKNLKAYGMLQKYDDSKRFLQENPDLVCEETANYLVIWCINLEMEEKTSLMEHVAHQCICMQFILELSRHLNRDPRSCVSSFFSKIQIADVEYRKGFEDELKAFKERIQRRAKEKIEAAVTEAEEEERKNRLGPGGLDPVEVFESLPQVLKECFETQNIELLQQAISTLPEEEARYHMKRCVDSGLWVPDANSGKKE